MGEATEKAPEGAVVAKRNYNTTFTGGTIMTFEICATLRSYNADDVEEILSKWAELSRKFYLEAGTELKNMP